MTEMNKIKVQNYTHKRMKSLYYWKYNEISTFFACVIFLAVLKLKHKIVQICN